MKLPIATLALCLSATALAQKYTPKVIYGEDNRHDLYEYKNPAVAKLARSTVVLIKTSNLTTTEQGIKTDTTTYKRSGNLCDSERFANQPNAGFCSGFLIAPNKIMTAGHCIESPVACSNTSFAFDYAMVNETQARTVLRPDQVYSCKKILGWNKDAKGTDFAIIEIDREVKDREPLKLSDNKSLFPGVEILVVGHPSGLPTKVTDSANVRTINNLGGFFVANLDTYGGNSGSAVFNARTLEVEGILVRGEQDFTTEGECRVSNRIGAFEGRGEDVTLVSRTSENGEPVIVPRYVWLESDQSCNEFHGSTYVREVDSSYCANAPTTEPQVPSTPSLPEIRYVRLGNSCNEFHSYRYIRGVPESYCVNPPVARYVYVSPSNTCVETRDGRTVRDVPLSFCTIAPRYVWLNADQTCNEFRGDTYVRTVEARLCGK